MSTARRPGNEPDPGDMSAELDPHVQAREPAAGGSAPPDEEEAAKLGDFA